MQQTDSAVLDWSVPVSGVPAGGRKVAKVATEAERAAFAAALDLGSCTALTADLHVTPRAGGQFRVQGRARAEIVQACVVTLEPLASVLDETIDVEYRAPGDVPDIAGGLELDDAPEIEAIRDDVLDIGRVVYDCLAAAVDLYPRKPGVEFDPAAVPGAKASPEGPAGGPFAALAKLKIAAKPPSKT